MPAIAAESPRAQTLFEAHDSPIEMSARRAGAEVKVMKAACRQSIGDLGQQDGETVKGTMGSPIADIECIADTSVEDEKQPARNC